MRFRRRTDDEIPAEAVAHLPPTPGLEGLRIVAELALDKVNRPPAHPSDPQPIRSTGPLPGKKVGQPKRGRRT